MRVAWGGEVAELHRPTPDTVKRGYGRVLVVYADGQWFNHYPGDRIILAPDEDAPADPTMDGWPGRWWPVEEQPDLLGEAS